MQDKTEQQETTQETEVDLRDLFRKVEDSLTTKLNEKIKKEIKRVEVDLFTRYELNTEDPKPEKPEKPKSDIIAQYKEII